MPFQATWDGGGRHVLTVSMTIMLMDGEELLLPMAGRAAVIFRIVLVESS